MIFSFFIHFLFSWISNSMRHYLLTCLSIGIQRVSDHVIFFPLSKWNKYLMKLITNVLFIHFWFWFLFFSFSCLTFSCVFQMCIPYLVRNVYFEHFWAEAKLVLLSRFYFTSFLFMLKTKSLAARRVFTFALYPYVHYEAIHIVSNCQIQNDTRCWHSFNEMWREWMTDANRWLWEMLQFMTPSSMREKRKKNERIETRNV